MAHWLRHRNMRMKSQIAGLCSCWLVLVLAAALPAPAQQPDAPGTAKLDATPQATAVNEADPSNNLPADDGTETMFPHFKDTRFWLSGQANFIFQTHPDFHADYSGTNSLSPRYEKATSRVLTLYTGVRLSNSTEILVDIEEAGGAALSTGLGLAGDTDLDIVRNPSLSKSPYLARGMIHHVFALSKDKVENQRTAFSLFDELPRRRLEVRVGKFSMPDFFDINSVGSDTHLQFTNWTIDNNGAYDYAADTRGYTVGATADYEDRNWGFRFAEALMPKVANGIDLVWKPWQVHAENFEYELRHGMIPKKSGVVRLLAYTNYANMGIYREQIALGEENHVAPAITDHPWHITRKYGFGVNLEQNLTQPRRHLGASAGTMARRSHSRTRKWTRLSPEDWSERRVVASQAGPGGSGGGEQCDLQGPSDLSCRWRAGLSAGRWQAELWPREHRGVLLHGARVARHLSCAGRAAHQ